MAARQWVLYSRWPPMTQSPAGCPSALASATATTPDRSRWHIVRLEAEGNAAEEISIPPDTAPEAIGGLLADALETQGYQGEPVLLALCSLQCLAACVPMENPTRGRQRQTLLYQLEEYLPLAAENVAADFIAHSHEEVFAVAVDVSSQQSIVEALEDRGVHVQSISPLALLALQHYRRPAHGNDPYVILWEDGERVELFRMRDGKLAAWRTSPADCTLLALWLRFEAITGAPPVAVRPLHLSPNLLESLRAIPDIRLEEAADEPLLDAALGTAQSVLSGKERPWIELRRDALSPRDAYRSLHGSLHFAAIAAAVFLLAFSAVLLRWNRAYRELAQHDRAAQAAIFGEIFPGQPVPTGIRSRLESERKKMAGNIGKPAGSAAQRSPLALLYDLLAAVPEGLRCRLLSIRLDGNHVQVEGELRLHSDADVIVAGLQQRGLHVDPPRTQQLSGQGVSVRLEAKPNGDRSSAPGDSL